MYQATSELILFERAGRFAETSDPMSRLKKGAFIASIEGALLHRSATRRLMAVKNRAETVHQLAKRKKQDSSFFRKVNVLIYNLLMKY